MDTLLLRRLFLAVVGLFSYMTGSFNAAFAQDPFALQREVQTVVEDDNKVKAEVAKIHDLKISPSQALLTKELDQAQEEIDSYTAYIESGTSIKQKAGNLHAKESDALRTIDVITSTGKNCKQLHDFDGVEKALIALRSYYQTSGFDVNFGFFGTPAPSDPDDAEIMAKVARVLPMDGRGFCKDVTDNGVDVDALKQSFIKSISIIEKQADTQISDFEKKSPRAQQALSAWTDRKTQLEKALEQQSGTASTVANYLPYIIASFCIFALLVFLILMKFPEKSQMELISSGQVIQFATVIVLLIVVCILGMAKFISDSTLGTLLGGISGYVLSQGVGRQERHAATKDEGQGSTQK